MWAAPPTTVQGTDLAPAGGVLADPLREHTFVDLTGGHVHHERDGNSFPSSLSTLSRASRKGTHQSGNESIQ